MKPELKEKFDQLNAHTQKELIDEFGVQWFPGRPQPYGCDLLFVTYGDDHPQDFIEVDNLEHAQMMMRIKNIYPALYAVSSASLLRKVDLHLAHNASRGRIFSSTKPDVLRKPPTLAFNKKTHP